MNRLQVMHFPVAAHVHGACFGGCMFLILFGVYWAWPASRSPRFVAGFLISGHLLGPLNEKVRQPRQGVAHSTSDLDEGDAIASGRAPDF